MGRGERKLIMLASDLQGLGVNPLQAQRTANAGIGPLTITATGTNFATAKRLGGAQYLVSCTNANGTVGVALPPVGGDTGALIGDPFTINNASTNSLPVFASTGVVISVGGANTSSTTLTSHVSLTAYPISTTQWIGILGT
jgi:hypothetical protein